MVSSEIANANSNTSTRARDNRQTATKLTRLLEKTALTIFQPRPAPAVGVDALFELRVNKFFELSSALFRDLRRELAESAKIFRKLSEGVLHVLPEVKYSTKKEDVPAKTIVCAPVRDMGSLPLNRM